MDAFPHLKILISLILGLAITRILSGLSRRLQQPALTEGMFAQIVWSLVLLLGAVHFWWWEFALRRIEAWHFGAYVFVLSYTSLHFLMATLLYPDALNDHGESERFFMRRRALFFGLFGLSFGFDMIDTLMKGTDHLQALGPEYPVRLGLGVFAAALAWRARDQRQVGLIGLAWLAYDLIWIVRRYDGLD